MERVLCAVTAVLVVIAISSCEDVCIDEGSSVMTVTNLTACVEGSYTDTKTVIDLENDFDIKWTKGDAINVFFGASESSKFVTETSGDVAQFKGSVDVVTGGGEGLDDDTSLWGVYPYSTKTTCDGNTIIYTLPSVQEAKAGSFAEDLFPQIARSQNFYMSFYNLCGSFRFKVANSDIVKVTLKGNKGEPIAGRAKISMEGVPVVEEILDGVDELVMNAPDGECFKTDTWYLFVLYPTVFENGLTITFHKKDSQASYVYSKPYTLTRNKFSYFDKKDMGLTFEKVEEEIQEGIIVFADAVMKEMCVNAFDTNGDSELSYAEAAAVTDLNQMTLTKKSFKTFDEFQYFTGVKTIPAGYFEEIGIKSIVLPESIKSVGSNAFCGCTSLSSATIPESVTSIGNSTFSGCTSLTSVTIPESVTSIGNSTFSGCTSLTSVTIPESVTSIGNSMFYGCTSLTSVTIPESVTSIGNSTFSGCTSLTSVTIPESVTSIGNSTFSGCTSLTSVTIPESVTSIGSHMFYGCTSLISVTIPKSVTRIGTHMFSGCTSLTSVTIPESVTSIGEFLFSGCTSLTSVTIPESVTSIGSNMFEDCTSLTSVTIPESVTSIGNSMFNGCISLNSVTIPKSVTRIGSDMFYGCTSLTSVTIPESVTSIGSGMFYGCTSLTSVTIPESVTSIGYAAFYGCTSLTNVTIPESVTSIESSTFLGCTSLTSVTIPESVTSIGDSMFRGCTSLTSVTIPESVTSIGYVAFYGCTSLTNVTIPESVTSIGSSTFLGCTSLNSVTIPESVTSIGSSTFSGCTSLASIFVRCLVPPSLGSSVFYRNASDMKIYVPQASLDAYKEAEGWSSYSSSIVTAE